MTSIRRFAAVGLVAFALVSIPPLAEATPPPEEASWTFRFESRPQLGCLHIQVVNAGRVGSLPTRLFRIRNNCEATFRMRATSCNIEKCHEDDGCSSVTCNEEPFEVAPGETDRTRDAGTGDAGNADGFSNADDASTDTGPSGDTETTDADATGSVDTGSNDADVADVADAGYSGPRLDRENSVSYYADDLGLPHTEDYSDEMVLGATFEWELVGTNTNGSFDASVEFDPGRELQGGWGCGCTAARTPASSGFAALLLLAGLFGLRARQRTN